MHRTTTIGIALSLAMTLMTHSAPGSTGFERYETPGLAPVNSWWLDTADGGVLVFDTLRTMTNAKAAIAKLRQRRRPVRGIFITHPHPDHVTGLGTFKGAFPDAPIYSTEKADAWLKAHGRELLKMNVQARKPGDATDDIPPASHFVRDGDALVVGGTRVEIMLLEGGESPAAISYFISDRKLLIAGDVLTPGRVPLLAGAETAKWWPGNDGRSSRALATRVHREVPSVGTAGGISGFDRRRLHHEARSRHAARDNAQRVACKSRCREDAACRARSIEHRGSWP